MEHRLLHHAKGHDPAEPRSSLVLKGVPGNWRAEMVRWNCQAGGRPTASNLLPAIAQSPQRKLPTETIDKPGTLPGTIQMPSGAHIAPTRLTKGLTPTISPAFPTGLLRLGTAEFGR